eukprot:TRINITY_DN39631_c0_g1_i1.p1 TRINITY_DN39631_c0_g1~~TRINITY_DN39631_c0_g1_i1.p1  ORF type:complete len:350 (+),score=59.01 TRINITY_DN39631_c0_g1_i1:59-1108(+)
MTADPLLASLLGTLVAEAEEPARAVIPLALYLVTFTAFAEWLAGLDVVTVFKPEMLLGVPITIAGLACFKLGLRKGLMPLGERLGERLPEVAGTAGVAIISFALAIGLTFAEPAIGALQEAATLLDARRALLLGTLFGNPTCLLLLVLAIGVGVGIAAVTGTLRLLNDWDVKRMIYWTLLPCMLATVAWSFISEDLTSLVGLAWDGGAVTTGPVTVPVVISLGMGLSVARAGRQRNALFERAQTPPSGLHKQIELAMAEGGFAAESSGFGYSNGSAIALDNSPGSSGDNEELKGFGIVTFASLWPVLGVLLLGAVVQPTVSLDDGLLELPSGNATDSAPDSWLVYSSHE